MPGFIMFIATARISDLQEGLAARLVETLSDVRRQWHGRPIEGLVQTYLLRGDRGTTLLVSVWDTRRDMLRYIGSEQGGTVSATFGRLFEDQRVELEEFRPSWTGLGASG